MRAHLFGVFALALSSAGVGCGGCACEKRSEPPRAVEAPGQVPTSGPAPRTMVVGGNAALAVETAALGTAAADAVDAGALAEAPAEAGGKGAIQGVVALSGPPPVMPPLKRGSDPVCSKTPMNDEQVLVKDGKLQNVLVRLGKNAPAGPLPSEPVIVDQEACMYRPRVLGAMVRQPLLIRNSDGTLHNVHSYEGLKTLFNFAQPPRSAPIEKVFSEAGIIKLKCDVHPWMTAYIVVIPHPYFAITGEGGAFILQNVPEGSYTLEAWHERFGVKTLDVTVKAGETAQVTFTYSPGDRG